LGLRSFHSSGYKG